MSPREMPDMFSRRALRALIYKYVRPYHIREDCKKA